MGNASGKSKQKPRISKKVPGGDGRLFKVTFLEEEDHEEIKLEEHARPDAYYLPWANGTYTEGEITLGMRQVHQFFTANLSGCSLWYKFESGKIKIRHEARPDEQSQWLHSSAGYTLVIDSNENAADIQLFFEGETKRIAQYYVVYALLDYKEKVIEFRSQLVKHVKDMNANVEHFTLVKLTLLSVDFPGSS